MSLLDGDLAALFGAAFAPLYRNATLTKLVPTDDGAGGFTTSPTPSAAKALVEDVSDRGPSRQRHPGEAVTLSVLRAGLGPRSTSTTRWCWALTPTGSSASARIRRERPSRPWRCRCERRRVRAAGLEALRRRLAALPAAARAAAAPGFDAAGRGCRPGCQGIARHRSRALRTRRGAGRPSGPARGLRDGDARRRTASPSRWRRPKPPSSNTGRSAWPHAPSCAPPRRAPGRPHWHGSAPPCARGCGREREDARPRWWRRSARR